MLQGKLDSLYLDKLHCRDYIWPISLIITVMGVKNTFLSYRLINSAQELLTLAQLKG